MKYERKKEREERGGRYRKLTITVLELKEIGGNTVHWTVPPAIQSTDGNRSRQRREEAVMRGNYQRGEIHFITAEQFVYNLEFSFT